MLVRFVIFALFVYLMSSCSGLNPHQTNSKNWDAGPSIDWPVDNAILTQKFKMKRRGRPHLGIDLAAPKGTPVFASHSGRVIYKGNGFSGYGRLIIIESSGRHTSFYAHLNRTSVREGQWVKIGQKLGGIGKTGNATGYHLHFELRINKTAVNPLPYLPGGLRLSQRPAESRFYAQNKKHSHCEHGHYFSPQPLSASRLLHLVSPLGVSSQKVIARQ